MESSIWLLLLHIGTTLVMAVQLHFFFNTVFGSENSKSSKKYWIAVFLPLGFAYFALDWPNIVSSLMAVGIIFLVAQGYAVSQKLKVMFTILYAVLLTLINLMLMYLFIPSVQSDVTLLHETPIRIWMAITLLISCTVMFAVTMVIRFVVKRRRFPLEARYSLPFLSVPLITIYLVNVFTIYSQKNVHYFIAIFGFIVLNVLVVYMLDTLIARFHLTLQNDRLQRQMDYQDANYEKTVHSFKEIKRIIHDTNKHMLVVAEYIERGRSEEAIQHIRTTLDHIDHAYVRVNTGNLVVDALLTNTLNVGRANGIRIDTELRLREPELPIERYDLSIVLGNMLDNAIEASKSVRQAEDRLVRIEIRSSESALFIRVRNQTERQVTELHTRKSLPDDHGFGLTNIERICEKYGGHMTIETEAHTFDNMVMLPFSA
ncbi:GHKL domain-containing protein [Paenibacillus wenxiniae]|uniref:GHKL domain-containing protein n=1 Tax=Paenibacillus wenxiniae TaxID=1636843 RepID=A0ABW4RM02_9BACL